MAAWQVLETRRNWGSQEGPRSSRTFAKMNASSSDIVLVLVDEQRS
jgi:hypothetical protein